MTEVFEIGTTQGGLTALSTVLDDGPIYLPEWSHQDFSRYETLGDGTRKGLGYPVVKWLFKGLNILQREALRSLCSTVSAAMFIHTPTNETSSGARVWKDYECVMHWREGAEVIDDGIDRTLMLELTFTHCVDVTPA